MSQVSLSDPLPYSVGIIVICPDSHDQNHISKAHLPTFFSTLTQAGISHTKIFQESIRSISALSFTTLRLSKHVDGIIVFFPQLLDPAQPKDSTSPHLEALQHISQQINYPAIVPGFISCLNTPESLLEMKGIMKHVIKDWVMHLLAIFEISKTSPSECLQMISPTEVYDDHFLNHHHQEQPTDSIPTILDDESSDNISELTDVSLTSGADGLAAGKSSREQQRSRDSEVFGTRKKRGTGGASTIVLG